MSYLGSWKIDDYLTFCCNTHDPDTGVATDADAVPTYRVYEDETGAAILTGSTAKLDDANTTGFYSERIQLTAANGFEKGKCYTIYISATVDSDTGTMHHNFQMEAEVDANTVSDSQISTIDTVVDAIKAVTDNLPNSGALNDLATILTDTGELQTDLTDGGRLDLLVDAIKAKTDNLPADPADDSDIDTQLAAIKAETALIVADTNEVQTDLADGGRLDLLVDAILADTGTDGVQVAGIKAAALADMFDTDSGTDYASAVAGSVVKEIADNAGGSALTEAGIADAVWDEALGDHDTEDTVGNVLSDLTEESGGTYRFTSGALAQAPTGGAGSGAITFTYTLTSSVDASPVADADVWVTSDQAGSNVLASGTTDQNGEVVFYLDAGTVYVWRQKSGWNFTNPDTETVA